MAQLQIVNVLLLADLTEYFCNYNPIYIIRGSIWIQFFKTNCLHLNSGRCVSPLIAENLQQITSSWILQIVQIQIEKVWMQFIWLCGIYIVCTRFNQRPWWACHSTLRAQYVPTPAISWEPNYSSKLHQNCPHLIGQIIQYHQQSNFNCSL